VTALYSASANHTSPHSLSGATVPQGSFIYLAANSGVRKVRFKLRNASLDVVNSTTDDCAPFDFIRADNSECASSAQPLSSLSLPAGLYTLETRVYDEHDNYSTYLTPFRI
jgi:hypothetical protein